MVVAAIIGLMLGATVYGFRSIAKSDLRSSASKLAGAIRYCFDRAVTTGSYFRLVLDLDGNKYWAERSDDRTYLTAGKEDSPGRGQALDVLGGSYGTQSSQTGINHRRAAGQQ